MKGITQAFFSREKRKRRDALKMRQSAGKRGNRIYYSGKQKGITPVIAIVLLLMITIAIVGFSFTFLSGMFQTTTETTGKQIAHQLGAMSSCMQIDSIYGNNVYIRNCGSGSLYNFSVYVDGKNIAVQNPSLVIGENGIGKIILSEGFAGEKIKVSSSSASIEQKAPAISVYISEGENEKFSNGGRCSPDLYVLENKKVRFFVALPPIHAGDCSSGSYPEFSGTPMRIWTKNSDSPSYRKDSTVIDDTLLMIPSTVINNRNNFYAIENGLEIQFNQQGNIKPKARYTMSENSNYVKVELRAENVGTSAATVRLYWYGDQDGAGTCHFQSGLQGSCSTADLGLNHGEKWLAEWTAKNDIMGYIVQTGEVEIYANYESVRVEETSSTTLQPGETHTFVFYIVSDFKGPAGNEWKPIQDTYNNLI
ncbi:MAG: type IV pilin N-terminal domain-containing protein [Candidatus Aenigmarchaeota archaeon]|nr:type IV pilin N-terminal domain-containing protein [Candidatus Aenigmarchaeota archaeon]